MKYPLLIAFTILIHVQLSAQKLGIQVGTNISNVKEEYSLFGIVNTKKETQTQTQMGIRTGLLAEYEHKTGITAGIQALYSRLGYKYESIFQPNTTIKITYNYLELPVYLGYNYTINDDVKIFYDYYPIKAFITVGPNFGIALSGNQQLGVNDPSEIEFGDTSTDTKRLNTQLMLAGGINVGGLCLTLGYNAGLSDLANGDNITKNTKNFFVMLGYVYDFGK